MAAFTIRPASSWFPASFQSPRSRAIASGLQKASGNSCGCSPHQVVLPAPLPPITVVSFGIGGWWPVPFAFAVIGPEPVIWPVRVSRRSTTPPGGSVMMILPSSSEAYTHAFPA